MFIYSRFPIDEDEEMKGDVGNHGSKSDFGSEIKADIRVEAGEAGDEASESRNEAKESGYEASESGYERNGFRNEIREAGDGGRDSTSACGSTNETKAARRIDTALKEDFGKRIVEEVCTRGIRGIDQQPNHFQLIIFMDKGDWVTVEMLNQPDPKSGLRIFEVGSGNGKLSSTNKRDFLREITTKFPGEQLSRLVDFLVATRCLERSEPGAQSADWLSTTAEKLRAS